MVMEFKFEDPGEGIHEGEIIDILVSEGDRVAERQDILVIETDKASVDVPSPFAGVVREIRVGVGDIVHVGDVLMTFGEAGEEAEAPKRAETARREPEAEAEEAEAETEAKRRERRAPEEEEEPAEPPAAEERAARRGAGPVPATPATRRLARKLDVDVNALEGSGPDGRVTEDDVLAAAGRGRPAPRREAAAEPLPDFGKWGEIERRPLRSIRRTMAKQMARAWSEIPHVTHREVADVTELESFRRRNEDEVARQGGRLTLTVFALKAAVAALKEFPRFNASLDAAAEEVILKHYYRLGVAIDTEQGLVVPVIGDVDQKSVLELAVELAELGARAREGAVRRDAMLGGTFTITNIGAMGGTGFTPIINYPEVAILGLAQARLAPKVQGDIDEYEIVPRLELPLCVAFDHRVIDGAEAARFTGRVVTALSDPEEFMLTI